MKSQLLFFVILFLISLSPLHAQMDSIWSKLNFELDFRFRAEQDWDSRKSDGTFREDRSRLRYRFRTGASFRHEWYTFGFRIRTGAQNKQQDPQLTLGKGLEEFGTLPLGFEKIYFKGEFKKLRFWLGKYDYSFHKNNELFWSDNVFPEGVFIEHDIKLDHHAFDKISLKASHYILSSNDGSFLKDAYLQGLQSAIHFVDDRFLVFPSVYLFRNVPDIPDGNHSSLLDYSILHLGTNLKFLEAKTLIIDFDLYQNMEDYEKNTAVPAALKNQKTGYSVGVQYGVLNQANEWMCKLTYTYLQRYAALDYMAQNDWARWDYSAFDSPDGRLTNLKGIEAVIGYNLTAKADFVAKYYLVNQLVPEGSFRETGQRIRLDLNVKM